METTVSTGTILVEEDKRKYLFTERACHQDRLTDNLIRTAVKIHAPVPLQALAMLRTGIDCNLINQSLTQTLNLVPTPTTEIVIEPIGNHKVEIYGEHTLNVIINDNTGEARSFKLTFLAADIVEDMILGSEWIFDAEIGFNFRSKIFLWKGNTEAKATTGPGQTSM